LATIFFAFFPISLV